MEKHELPSELRRDLDFAIRAARLAGARVLTLRASGRWKDDQLADIGDQAADGFLQGLIQGRYPEDAILSEETADSHRRLGRARVWIVDPLDGTREYSQLRDDWAVHVALTVDGACVLGAVALPAQDRVLWGVCARDVRCAGLEGSGQLVSGSGSSATGSMRMAVSRSHTPAWMPRLSELLGLEPVPAGSVGNKVALLALGSADLYAHRTGLKEWDTCAPECIARALGWHVSRLRGEVQVYNQSDPRNDEFLVCRPADRERVLGALRDSGALASTR